MKTPTKKQRHSIYIATKKVAIKDNDNDVGLCYWLTHNPANRFNSSTFFEAYGSEMLTNFPEIAERKPETFSWSNGGYWFPLDDKQSRLDILDRAITETEPKAKVK